MNCICNDVNNEIFDSILQKEIKIELSFNEIIKKSIYIHIETDSENNFNEFELLSNNEILKSFKEKKGLIPYMGIYRILWRSL